MSPRYHVEPVNDLIPHNTNGLVCVCNPRITMEGVVVHNSFDKREELEQMINDAKEQGTIHEA